METAQIGKVGQAPAAAVFPSPPLIAMPSPNFNERPAGMAIDTVVLHHTAGRGTAQDTARWFQDPGSRVSSHYIVGKDGAVVECVTDNMRAWHAGRSAFLGRGNVNDFSVGIEISNTGDGVDPYPPAQYEAVARLTAHLISQYHIPLERITRHRDIALPPGRKNDTSDNFDTAWVKRAATELLAGHPLPTPPVQVAPQATPHPELPDWLYRVKPGDTLWGIAKDEFGDGRRWQDLQQLNAKQVGPDGVIRAGQILHVPLDQ